jgi:putative phosphoesterase
MRRIPDECLRRLERAELILHAGDVVAESVLEDLCALGRVHAVFGNMDESALRESLPRDLVVDAGGARMVHVPGPRVRREERLAARFPGCDAVVYGHTHVPQVERHGHVWILNPGSPTERRSAPVHSMLELEIEAGEIRPHLVTLS